MESVKFLIDSGSACRFCPESCRNADIFRGLLTVFNGFMTLFRVFVAALCVLLLYINGFTGLIAVPIIFGRCFESREYSILLTRSLQFSYVRLCSISIYWLGLILVNRSPILRFPGITIPSCFITPPLFAFGSCFVSILTMYAVRPERGTLRASIRKSVRNSLRSQ